MASPHGDLRDIMCAISEPEKPRAAATVGVRQATRYGVSIHQGRTVFEFAKTLIGDKAVSHSLTTGVKLRLPKGFWPGCCQHCFRRVCTDALRKSLNKSLCFYMQSLRTGATTTCGMLGDKDPNRMRSDGGSLNRILCPELGHLLYDWFIDCIQVYNARVNHQLFMRQAQYLKQRLLDNGYRPDSLPNLEGEAGKSWFRRWRRRFNVRSRQKVKHLKVSPIN